MAVSYNDRFYVSGATNRIASISCSVASQAYAKNISDSFVNKVLLVVGSMYAVVVFCADADASNDYVCGAL